MPATRRLSRGARGRARHPRPARRRLLSAQLAPFKLFAPDVVGVSAANTPRLGGVRLATVFVPLLDGSRPSTPDVARADATPPSCTRTGATTPTTCAPITADLGPSRASPSAASNRASAWAGTDGR